MDNTTVELIRSLEAEALRYEAIAQRLKDVARLLLQETQKGSSILPKSTQEFPVRKLSEAHRRAIATGQKRRYKHLKKLLKSEK